MWPNPQFSADLVTFTEEILNGKLHFFVQCMINSEDSFKIFPWKKNLKNPPAETKIPH